MKLEESQWRRCRVKVVNMSKTSIVVADDHPLLRDGIVNLLEKEADFEVIGQASDGEEAVRLVSERCPDVVVMDVEMPRMDGIDATRQIKSDHPEVSVIALTIHDGEEYIAAILDAGATGYLLKTTYGQELIQAIRAANLGEFILDTQIGNRVFRAYTKRSARTATPEMKDKLTTRELEVIKLVALGKTNEEISGPLGISLGAVKNHLYDIFSKLNVGSRTEAIVACLRGGILSLDDVS
jgi:NarL family two-component system response regulator LiaR